MPSIIELLQKAQRELRCPTCGRDFLLSEIRCRPHSNNTIMIQAVCSDNHFPIVLIIIPPQQFATTIKPLTKRDTTKLKDALTDFDGKFSKVW